MSIFRAMNEHERRDGKIRMLLEDRREIIEQIARLPYRDVGSQREARLFRVVWLITEEVDALQNEGISR